MYFLHNFFTERIVVLNQLEEIITRNGQDLSICFGHSGACIFERGNDGRPTDNRSSLVEGIGMLFCQCDRKCSGQDDKERHGRRSLAQKYLSFFNASGFQRRGKLLQFNVAQSLKKRQWLNGLYVDRHG